MLLAIDAGNTNLVFALLADGEIKARWRIATDPRRTADQYAVWLHQLLELEGYSKSDISAVIIGASPRYGICTSLIPAMVLNISANRCSDEPGPLEP